MKVVNKIVFLSLLSLVCHFDMATAEEPGKPIAAALVNGKPILKDDLNFYFSQQLQGAQKNGREMSPDMRDIMRKKLLQQLIERELLHQVAISKKIVVEDKEVESNFSRAKSQGLTMPPEKMKKLIRANIMIDKVIRDQVINKIDVPEKDLKEFYEKNKDKIKMPEQVRARHILIKTTPTSSEKELAEAKKKIEAILAEVKTGKKEFADLAKEHSQGPSASSGGDLGFFGKGRMVPPFETAAFALKPGAVSDIVKTQFGFHVIKVEEKKEAKAIPFEEAKGRIRQQLMQGQIQGKIQTWISELKSAAKIVLAENKTEKK